MDYERTMRLYQEEIDKTAKKIQQYYRQSSPPAASRRKSLPYETQRHEQTVRIHPQKKNTKNSHLQQQQVCCITILPVKNNKSRVKTEQNERLSILQTQNPQIDNWPSFNSLSKAQKIVRLPQLKNSTLSRDLVRQSQIERLRKYKDKLVHRAQDVYYINKGMQQYPYGHDHFERMQRIVSKMEEQEKRNQQILKKFQRQAEQFKKNKSRIAHEVAPANRDRFQKESRVSNHLANENLILQQEQNESIYQEGNEEPQVAAKSPKIIESSNEVSNERVLQSTQLDRFTQLRQSIKESSNRIKTLPPEPTSLKTQYSMLEIKKHLQLLKRRRRTYHQK